MIKSHKKNPKKMNEITNFIKVEVKNPKNDPNAALKAFLPSVRLKAISPINAPTKGPINIPKGIGDKIPRKRPIKVPIAPALLPPKCLVPNAGII